MKLSNLQWMAIVLLVVGTTTSQFGAIFNIGRLFLDDFRGGFGNAPWWDHLFNGYTITPWLVVLNIRFTGLLVSWLMTYAGNIVEVVLFMTCIFFLSLSSSFIIYGMNTDPISTSLRGPMFL
ncbi:putative nucleotide-sugar transporter [Helianthus debilis subsp. tardiflorus]